MCKYLYLATYLPSRTHAADWRIPIPSYLYRHILLYTSILYVRVRAWSGSVLSLRSRKYYIILYVIIIGSIHTFMYASDAETAGDYRSRRIGLTTMEY